MLAILHMDLPPGSSAYLLLQDERYHEVEIVDRRLSSDGVSPEYYVHFVHSNRRTDRWMPEKELAKLVYQLDGPRQIKRRRVDVESTSSQSSSLLPETSIPVTASMMGRRLTRRDQKMMADTESVRACSLQICHSVFLPQDTVNTSDPFERQFERDHEVKTKVRNVAKLQLGDYEIDGWYWTALPTEVCSQQFHPFPLSSSPFQYQNVDILYMCAQCLLYWPDRASFIRHSVSACFSTPLQFSLFNSERVHV